MKKLKQWIIRNYHILCHTRMCFKINTASTEFPFNHIITFNGFDQYRSLGNGWYMNIQK